MSSGWTRGALRRFATIVNGGTPDADEANWNGDVAWATPVDLGRVDGSHLNSTQRTLTRLGLERGSAEVPAGSCLLSTRAPIGYVTIVDQATAFNQGCKGVIPKVGLEARILLYALLAARAQMVALGQGSTFVELSSSSLGSLELVTPPTRLQADIADYLDRETAEIDAFIADQEELIALLEERRQATVDLEFSTRPSTRQGWSASEFVDKLPNDWKSVRNKDLYRERSELSLTGDEEVLSVSHITGVTPRAEKTVYMTAPETWVGYKLVEPGDLVINTMWAWMGALGVSRDRGIVSPAYGVYAPRLRDVNSQFLHHLYRSRGYVAGMTVASRGLWSSRLRLYPEVFLALPVRFPTLVEQSRIVARIEARTQEVDATIADAREAIALSKERRAALISAAVTGQIDVTERKRVLV